MSNFLGLPDYFPLSSPTVLTEGLVPTIVDLGHNTGVAANIVLHGYNQGIKPIVQRTNIPPEHEKPIYVYKYHTMGVGHVGMYYDGERVDLYPRGMYEAQKDNNLAGQFALTAIYGQNKPDAPIFRPEANVPEDVSEISCYAIYPSQLNQALNLNLTPVKIKTSMQQVKSECNPYKLYDNNCADQVINVFKKIGVDMSETKPEGIVALPSSVENFARVNGYDVPFEGIPFDNNHRTDMVHSFYVAREQFDERFRQYQEAFRQSEQSYDASLQTSNPLAVQESTRVAFNPGKIPSVNSKITRPTVSNFNPSALAHRMETRIAERPREQPQQTQTQGQSIRGIGQAMRFVQTTRQR